MPTRVTVLADAFPTTSETFVVDHVVGLARRGFETSVVCGMVNTEQLGPVLARAGAPLDVRPLAARGPGLGAAAGAARDLVSALSRAPRAAATPLGRSLLLRAPAAARALRALRPDLVHAHFASNGLVACAAAPAGTPLVVDLHGWDFTSLPGLVGWPALRGALRRAHLVVHSGFAAARVGEGLRRDMRRVALGVDARLFAGPSRDGPWPSPLRLLAVGRLVAQKGHAVAIAALAALRRGPEPLEAVLRVVGEGPERPALATLALRLGVAGAVELVGALPQEAVAREMAAADVLLVPSVRTADGAEEAFGRVALEGLAAGLAVVASATGGLPETVGDAGWTVPPDDAVALADRVREVVTRHPRAECAARARERAARFGLERMWDEYAGVARDALAAARADRWPEGA